MTSLVLSGAQDDRRVATRCGILAALARAPVLSRFLQRTGSTCAALPFSILPENLLVYLFHFAGVPATLNASLACRAAYAQLWQSPTFWRASLQLFGASEASLLMEGRFSCPGCSSIARAKAYRDLARHLLFGVDVLIGTPVHLEPVTSTISQLHRRQSRRASDFKLEDARRAVFAMLPEDGEVLIQRATETIVDMLLNRACGESELLKAEELLEAVASRCDLFTTGQMLDMLGAHQKADEALSLKIIPKIHPCISLRPDGARPSRRARREAALAA